MLTTPSLPRAATRPARAGGSYAEERWRQESEECKEGWDNGPWGPTVQQLVKEGLGAGGDIVEFIILEGGGLGRGAGVVEARPAPAGPAGTTSGTATANPWTRAA